jgi:hypothetical protein
MSYYGLLNPVFEEFDLSKYEGQERPLYFVKILGEMEDSYLVETRFSERRAVVDIDAELKVGEVVSFYGRVEEGRLLAEKYHVHDHPRSPYYLSIGGLILFLWIFRRGP